MYYATTTVLWSNRKTAPNKILSHTFIYYLSRWCLKEEGQMCITTDHASHVIKAVELIQGARPHAASCDWYV